ncbi:hypothetical protein VKT23_018817 [Stygiomarasmius scandens]|uniref:Uncharacterized protein n=1 Tax=Marasmiellus scandens TaxID=2682957 RepID=A0ABR1IQ61_9AGAR
MSLRNSGLDAHDGNAGNGAVLVKIVLCFYEEETAKLRNDRRHLNDVGTSDTLGVERMAFPHDNDTAFDRGIPGNMADIDISSQPEPTYFTATVISKAASKTVYVFTYALLPSHPQPPPRNRYPEAKT